MDDSDLTLGQRVAAIRRVRGWTQDGLALRLNRSTSWVTKVERGVLRVDSMSVLLELSRALGVPIQQLAPVSEPHDVPSQNAVAVDALRRLLDRSPALTVATGEPAKDGAYLAGEAATFRRLYNSSGQAFAYAAARLADVVGIAQLSTKEQRGSQRGATHAALANLYRLASLALRQDGDYFRARLALDRALASAEQSEDALLIASIAATLTVQLMVQGDPEDGVSLALDAIQMLGQAPTDAARDRDHVVGTLYLYAAQAAARASDRREAQQLMDRAEAIATQLADGETYCLIFGPTNLAIQRAGLCIDLNQPRDALRVSDALKPELLGSVHRTGYHHLHRARAYAMLGNHDRTLDALWSAWHAAPHLVRVDALGRDQVKDLVRRKRHLDERLRTLARVLKIIE